LPPLAGRDCVRRKFAERLSEGGDGLAVGVLDAERVLKARGQTRGRGSDVSSPLPHPRHAPLSRSAVIRRDLGEIEPALLPAIETRIAPARGGISADKYPPPAQRREAPAPAGSVVAHSIKRRDAQASPVSAPIERSPIGPSIEAAPVKCPSVAIAAGKDRSAVEPPAAIEPRTARIEASATPVEASATAIEPRAATYPNACAPEAAAPETAAPETATSKCGTTTAETATTAPDATTSKCGTTAATAASLCVSGGAHGQQHGRGRCCYFA
jgi:hypothetical protein